MANNSFNAEKPKKKSRFGTFLSKAGSELKKVTWPTFATVLQNTGIVLVVVVIFTIITTGIDMGLGALLELLIS